MNELASWDSFCVIVGSSAGALIGLQFVVLTLLNERPQSPSPEAGAAFGTPTVVHFGAVLLLCALLRAPWHSAIAAATAWGVLGAAGVVYMLAVLRLILVQQAYRPGAEDWLFYFVLPFLGYLALAASAFAAASHEHDALFAVGAGSLALLFTGIHNAWDSVAFHVFAPRHK